MTALFHAGPTRALLAVTELERAEPMRALGELDAAALLAVADELWEMPGREYQYVALDMLAMHWKKLGIAYVPALLHLVRRKSWWDTVDALACIIGDMLRHGHDFMDDAIAHDDFWMRRIALLHQLGWRNKTDKALLQAYCLRLEHEKEFFIQKAIGWALCDYARHDPDVTVHTPAGIAGNDGSVMPFLAAVRTLAI